MGPPPYAYDLARTTKLETRADKDKEARRRVRRLHLEAIADPDSAERLMDLADRIDPDLTSEPSTMASPVFMRDVRRHIAGGLWRQADRAQRRALLERDYAGPAMVHLIPAAWSVPRRQLLDWNPVAQLTAIRTDLYRKDQLGGGGAAQANGFLFLGLHGSFDVATDRFQIHLHGLAAGGMVAVVDGLRRLRKFHPAGADDGRDAVRTPIVIRRNVRDLPWALSYGLQSWWSGRETYLAEDGVRRAYGGPRRGMPRAAECAYLSFLDKHTVEDITLTVHLTATNRGLVLSKRPTSRKAIGR